MDCNMPIKDGFQASLEINDIQIAQPLTFPFSDEHISNDR